MLTKKEMQTLASGKLLLSSKTELHCNMEIVLQNSTLLSRTENIFYKKEGKEFSESRQVEPRQVISRLLKTDKLHCLLSQIKVYVLYLV